MSPTAAALALALSHAPATPAPAAPRPEILFYAASSLRDVLESVAPSCETVTGTRLIFNFGASNDLARQIEAAGKADLFFSADEAWMDRLAAAGRVDDASRRTLLSNRLVVVGAADVTLTIGSAAELARAPFLFLSLANPDAVPAGKYAKAWLEGQGIWESVRERVLPGIDVRGALAAVDSGAAELGIVYATDAPLAKRARLLFTVPEGEGPPIRYPIAALSDRPLLETSRAVAAWMAGPEAASIFRRFGFVVRDPS